MSAERTILSELPTDEEAGHYPDVRELRAYRGVISDKALEIPLLRALFSVNRHRRTPTTPEITLEDLMPAAPEDSNLE